MNVFEISTSLTPLSVIGTRLGPQSPPCSGTPKRPDYQQGLEEQPDQARLVRIQAKCVDAVHVLGNIAWEDRHKESRDNPAN